MSSVLYETEDRLARITLNRPEVRNAVSRDLLRSLHVSFQDALGDAGIDVILLKGAGQDFCAGEDLVELERNLPDDAEATRMIELFQEVTRQIMLGGKPVICAVQGWAIGAGGAWPLNADFTVWAEDSRLRFPESRHGLFASGGVTALLEKTCGQGLARDMLWLGTTLKGGQLVQSGLTSELVPVERLEMAGMAMAKRLLSLPRESLTRYKQVQTGLIEEKLAAALKAEADQMLGAVRHFREHGATFTFQSE